MRHLERLSSTKYRHGPDPSLHLRDRRRDRRGALLHRFLRGDRLLLLRGAVRPLRLRPSSELQDRVPFRRDDHNGYDLRWHELLVRLPE